MLALKKYTAHPVDSNINECISCLVSLGHESKKRNRIKGKVESRLKWRLINQKSQTFSQNRQRRRENDQKLRKRIELSLFCSFSRDFTKKRLHKVWRAIYKESLVIFCRPFLCLIYVLKVRLGYIETEFTWYILVKTFKRKVKKVFIHANINDKKCIKFNISISWSSIFMIAQIWTLWFCWTLAIT